MSAGVGVRRAAVLSGGAGRGGIAVNGATAPPLAGQAAGKAAMGAGGRVRRARRRRGLTLEVAAGRAGKSKAWLSMIENGRLQLDRLSDILALAAVLEVPVPALIGVRCPGCSRVPREVAAMGADPRDPSEGAESRAVDELDRAWGDTHDIGVTRGGVYWARRVDGDGEPLEADTADALDAAIRAGQVREVTR